MPESAFLQLLAGPARGDVARVDEALHTFAKGTLS